MKIIVILILFSFNFTLAKKSALNEPTINKDSEEIKVIQQLAYIQIVNEVLYNGGHDKLIKRYSRLPNVSGITWSKEKIKNLELMLESIKPCTYIVDKKHGFTDTQYTKKTTPMGCPILFYGRGKSGSKRIHDEKIKKLTTFTLLDKKLVSVFNSYKYKCKEYKQKKSPKIKSVQIGCSISTKDFGLIKLNYRAVRDKKNKSLNKVYNISYKDKKIRYAIEYDDIKLSKITLNKSSEKFGYTMSDKRLSYLPKNLVPRHLDYL